MTKQTIVKTKSSILFPSICLIVTLALVCCCCVGVGVIIAIVAIALGLGGLNDYSDFEVTGGIQISNSRRAIIDGVKITHVYAVSPLGEGKRHMKIAEIQPDGSFSLGIEKRKPWVFEFLDSSKVGMDMVKGIFETPNMHTIYPQGRKSNSSTNLQLTIERSPPSNRTGKASMQEEEITEFISNLGLTNDSASFLSAHDKLCLRNSNPDVDGDGKIDILDASFPDYWFRLVNEYILDFDGENIVDDYIKLQKPWPSNHNTAITLRASYVQIRWYVDRYTRDSFSRLPEKMIMEWSDKGSCPNYNCTADDGGLTPPQGEDCIAQPPHEYGGGKPSLNLGAMFKAEVPPSGTFKFKFFQDHQQAEPSEILTFSNVFLSANTSNVQDFLFMFLTVETDGSNKVKAVNYSWKKFDQANSMFVNATSDELEVFFATAECLISVNSDEGTGMHFVFYPYKNEFAVDGKVTEYYTTSGSGAFVITKIKNLTQRYTIFNGVEFSLTVGTF